jgi:hypothetical protein
LSEPRDSLSFSFAGRSDEADLRQLLGENPIRGAISVNFTREPDYFAGAQIAGGHDRTLIARENGRLVAAGHCVTRPCWLNGEVRPCAYLGELRLDASVVGRWDILRRGYAFFAADYARQPADFCFTSIIADNLRARKLFERGLPQLPRYELIGNYVTLLLPVGHRRPTCAFESVTGADVPLVELVCFLNEFARTRHLATYWTPELLTSLSSHGLRLQDFIVLKHKNSIIGCTGIWDQRTFRQVRIHSYATWLAASRPLVNLMAPVLGQPRLPAVGADLDQAFLSPLALTPERISALPALLDLARHTAAQRDLSYITAGYAENDNAFAPVWDKVRGRRYASRLYQVIWPGQKAAASRLDARPCLPDIALL